MIGIDASGETITGLYRAHRIGLLRLAVLLVRDRAVAEDIVQDAFAGLHRRWHRLQDPRAALGYLRTSVVNGARNAGRRDGVARRYLHLIADRDSAPSADAALLVAEQHRDVLLALHELPARQREVLVLRYWSELSEAEIAATLGISRGTVKSTASRGLDALEARLKELPA